jgi:hypothetical protein
MKAIRSAGPSLLGASILYSLLDLTGWLHPRLLRFGAHGPTRHNIAVILGSLTFKAVLLFSGAVLTFWPVRAQADRSGR